MVHRSISEKHWGDLREKVATNILLIVFLTKAITLETDKFSKKKKKKAYVNHWEVLVGLKEG